MNWINFPIYAMITILLWIVAIVLFSLSYKYSTNKLLTTVGMVLVGIGTAVLATFIVILWQHLDRPPMRTLGETRLWYSFFLPFIGLITYIRWRYKWFIGYSLMLAILFLFIDYMSPETYDKTLMPALQSPWFVPHVVVYIFAYALLAVSSAVGAKGLADMYFDGKTFESRVFTYNFKFDIKSLHLGDNLVYIGFAFLTLGLIFGALWAKEAWGHYWTWDPKETWAFLTWISYLAYMHFRYFQPKKVKAPLWTLSLAFIILLICWFGINYLPSAQNSVHVYSQ